MTGSSLVERLKTLLAPKHQTVRAKVDESSIKLRKSQDEVGQAMERLTAALKDQHR